MQIEGSLRTKCNKGKLKIKWDKTKLVSHFKELEGLLREERRREEKEEEEEEEEREEDFRYGLLWFCIDL